MNPLFIEAVGCCAPGLDGWEQAQAVLRGERAYQREEVPAYSPPRLPPNERRRATQAVRLAFRVAEDALAAPGSRDPASLATVFASSDGDTNVVHRTSLALAEPRREVSPTDFHNSVHNAAAGYWSIAARARLPSVSLSAGHASLAAGLLEAAAQAHGEALDCLMLAFDVRPPAPLLAHWPVTESAAFALILSPQRSVNSIAKLRIEVLTRAAETTMSEAALETLRKSNPAARALPLLRLLALRQAGTVLLDGAGEHSLRLDLDLQ